MQTSASMSTASGGSARVSAISIQTDRVSPLSVFISGRLLRGTQLERSPVVLNQVQVALIDVARVHDPLAVGRPTSGMDVGSAARRKRERSGFPERARNS